MGEEYILKAFQFAHEADSSALLFYNDYDAENPDKVKRITRLIKLLQDKGVAIHGIGLQAHWTTDYPSLDNIEEAIKTYSSLGLQVHITELEIVEPTVKNQSDLSKISKKYVDVFKIFRKYKKEITSVTFWKSSVSAQTYPPLFKKDFTIDERFSEMIEYQNTNE
jgi:endo-1,4-beta-xylanase